MRADFDLSMPPSTKRLITVGNHTTGVLTACRNTLKPFCGLVNFAAVKRLQKLRPDFAKLEPSPKWLVCSVGDRPTKVIVRSLVAWIPGRREIEFLMPIDKAIFRMGSKSSGRNESERRVGLEKWKPLVAELASVELRQHETSHTD